VELGAQDYLIKGSPDCCLLKRAIRNAIEKKRLSNVIDNLLGADPAPKKQESQDERTKAPEQAVALETAASTDHLKRLQEEIREGLRALEVKNHFMDQISHELRNTLATMKTAAYCLKEDRDGALTERQLRMVDMISRNVDRQTKIIDSLLELVLLRPDKLQIHFRRTDVAKVVMEVVKEQSSSGSTRRVEVDFQGELAPIEGDPELIAQVLRSLIGNAVRFAKDKVVVQASKADAEGVLISIIDDGPGIPPERVACLFTEFAPVGLPSDADSRPASGLGLTMCKEIITGHHGKLWAESTMGHGASFHFSLPANREAGRPAPLDGRVPAGTRPHTND